MSDLLTASNEVTCTVTRTPVRLAQRKTLRRLMQHEAETRRGLRSLQHRRKKVDNITYIRAGVPWTNRKRATKLCRVEPGAAFTLRLTPQLIPDIKSVEKFLDIKKA